MHGAPCRRCASSETSSVAPRRARSGAPVSSIGTRYLRNPSAACDDDRGVGQDFRLMQAGTTILSASGLVLSSLRAQCRHSNVGEIPQLGLSK